MAFLLRLLLMLSILITLAGVMIKVNHWSYDHSLFINAGIAGLAIYVVGTFLLGEVKKKKEGK